MGVWPRTFSYAQWTHIVLAFHTNKTEWVIKYGKFIVELTSRAPSNAGCWVDRFVLHTGCGNIAYFISKCNLLILPTINLFYELFYTVVLYCIVLKSNQKNGLSTQNHLWLKWGVPGSSLLKRIWCPWSVKLLRNVAKRKKEEFIKMLTHWVWNPVGIVRLKLSLINNFMFSPSKVIKNIVFLFGKYFKQKTI